MEYIAHIDEKDKKRIQTVKNHLEGTAKLSGEFAGKFGKEDWGYCNGCYMILESILWIS